MGVNIRIKRSYDNAESTDGYRVFVDWLWSRGLSKASFKYDEWYKALAPSTELRKWFRHDAKKWPEFQKRYLAEINGDEQQKKLNAPANRAKTSTITLLFSAKDTKHNQAVVLAAELKRLAR